LRTSGRTALEGAGAHGRAAPGDAHATRRRGAVARPRAVGHHGGMSSDDAKTVAEPAGTAESGRAPSTEPAAAAPAAGPETARRPKQRRMRDMALSLAVLLVPLGLFYWVWDWAATGREVSVVDTSQDYLAAESLGLETVEPELSEEWKAISSALATEEEAVTQRTGWYSPEGHGMQLVQTTGPAEAVHDELTGPGEAVEAGGLEWAAY